MAENTRDSGKKANNTELEYTEMPRAKKEKENGLMVKEPDGSIDRNRIKKTLNFNTCEIINTATTHLYYLS